jgi:hypothetical protein
LSGDEATRERTVRLIVNTKLHLLETQREESEEEGRKERKQEEKNEQEELLQLNRGKRLSSQATE